MATTDKDKFLISSPVHQSDFIKKCAISANMNYQDFLSTLLFEKCFEYMNEIRQMKGFPELPKTKVLKVSIPAKKKRAK